MFKFVSYFSAFKYLSSIQHSHLISPLSSTFPASMSSHLSQVSLSSHQYLSNSFIHSFKNISHLISSHFYNTFPASISSHLFQIPLSSHQIPLPNSFIHSFKYLSHLISLKYLSSIHLISSLPNTSLISSNASSKFIHSLIQTSLYSLLFPIPP